MTCWHANDKLITAGWIGGIKGMSPGSTTLSSPQITSRLALLANFFAFSPQCRAWSQVSLHLFCALLHRLKQAFHLLQCATCTSLTVNLICPALFSISLGTAVNTQEKWKTKVMQSFGGQIRCIMGNLQLAYGDCLQRSQCDVTNKEGYEKSLNKRYDSFDKMKMH